MLLALLLRRAFFELILSLLMSSTLRSCLRCFSYFPMVLNANKATRLLKNVSDEITDNTLRNAPIMFQISDLLQEKHQRYVLFIISKKINSES